MPLEGETSSKTTSCKFNVEKQLLLNAFLLIKKETLTYSRNLTALLALIEETAFATMTRLSDAIFVLETLYALRTHCYNLYMSITSDC